MKYLFLILLGIFIGVDFTIRNLPPEIQTETIVVQVPAQPMVKTLTVTAYSLRKEECNNDLEHTALMEHPIVGETAAISRDNLHLLGRKVYIEGYGIRTITDVMNKRWTNRIDLLMSTKKAKRFEPVKTRVALLED